MKNIELGKIYKQNLKVTKDLLAENVGSGNVSVFATPMMICLMEKTSAKSIEEFLDDGYTSVGIKIDVTHISATPIGFDVYVESEITEVDNKKVVFKVKAFDNCGLIGEGIHERVIVNKQNFEKKAVSKGD